MFFMMARAVDKMQSLSTVAEAAMCMCVCVHVRSCVHIYTRARARAHTHTHTQLVQDRRGGGVGGGEEGQSVSCREGAGHGA